MKWQILGGRQQAIGSSEGAIKVLLENRGFKTKKEVDEFLKPSDPYLLLPTALGIKSGDLNKTLKRTKLAIQKQEPIVVYGDYDADGICGTAILWECLQSLGANVMPFIPGREKEGYGLSKEGINTILQDTRYKIQDTNGLIIAVDSGIAASEAVEYANGKGLDVVVIDHHEKPKKLPKAEAIVHTERLCAAGIAYFVALRLCRKTTDYRLPTTAWLELAAIATVTDLMDLRGPNRSIVKYGLLALNKTERVGLKALYKAARIEKAGTYEIGFMIGPRLNASGRIESALTALRLLCTRDPKRAGELARVLDATNRDRQLMLEEQTVHALETQNAKLKTQNYGERIIVIEHESYHQGVIGLIAGKLVERYYLPAIVIAKGEIVSKASARSINGFNIIEAIRSCSEILINAGGHPMAAGFTIANAQISNFKFQISNYAKEKITQAMLEKMLKVDLEIPLSVLDLDFYLKLRSLEPYGIGNPEPVFASRVRVEAVRTVGQDGKHLKLSVSPLKKNDSFKESFFKSFDAIAFGRGEKAAKIKVGDEIEVAYTLALDTYNGGSRLQLKIRDIKHGESSQADPRI